jgi:hypothetical protein
MESLFAALKDTPIPTILVVAGIVFLLLSIAGQLAGRITVPPEQRRRATIIGCLLVVVGVALHVVPPMLNPPTLTDAPSQTIPPPAIEPDQPSPPLAPQSGIQPHSKVEQPPQPAAPAPSPEPSPSTSEPPVQAFTAKPIPSLNAQLTALRFFEGTPCRWPPLEERSYRQRFPKVMTRSIFTELTLEHPTHEREIKITIQGFYRHRGREINRPVLETSIPANRQKSVYAFYPAMGTGRFLTCVTIPRGHWSVGTYTVDLYIEGEHVTSGSFEIYE